MSDQVSDLAERSLALDPVKSFCVTAPAGSGKTELLIQRYLTLLARVEQPQEVLAITFTRKAAAEMRSRIGEALALAGDGERPAGAHSALTYDLARQVLERDRERGWQLIHGRSQLNIRTIDGFCGALTRQMPVLSRFGGPVSAVDDAVPYYREATRSLLEELDRGGAVAGDLATLLLHFNNDWSRLEALLVSMLASRDQWLVYLGTGLDRGGAEAAIKHSVEVICHENLAALDTAIAPWRTSLLTLWRYSSDNLGHSPVETWPGCETSDVRQWQSLAALLLTNEDRWRRAVDKRVGFPAGKGDAAEHKEAMTALLTLFPEQEGLLELLVHARHLPVTAPGDEHWERVLACSRLLPQLVARLTVVFQLHGAVDHTQVALAALDALGGDDKPTELALKLDYRLKHILVDEFQDTAVNQFELVRRLTRGWAEHNAENPEAARTLFIVGDGMQSIYGFRDADVGLFIKAKHQGFDDLKLDAITLKTNFRSDRGIVEWVNAVFTDAFPPKDNSQRGEIAFSPATAFHGDGEANPASVLAFPDKGSEAAWVANRLAEGAGDPDCESMAVLVRRKADLFALVPALKQRGISWQAQEIDKLAESPVVRDLDNLLRALQNPLDRVAWLALLRAPWCGLQDADLLALSRAGEVLWPDVIGASAVPGLSDDGSRRLAGVRDALIEILDYRERLSLRDWLELAWLRLDGPGCVEEPDQLEDADAFFTMLAQFEAEGGSYDPADLKERISRLFARTSSLDSKLHLMTLYKAKGLEFDWVFIPNLAHVTRGERRELLLCDEYHAASGKSCFMLAMDDDAEEGASTLYNYLYRQRKRKRQTESTRLLYVGATRAVRRLWLTSTMERREDGGWKPPGRNSLLGTVWGSVEPQLRMQDIDPDLVPPAAGADLNTRLLRRREPLPATGEPGLREREPNLPERRADTRAIAVGTVVHLTLQRLSSSPLPPRLDRSHFQKWWRRELQAHGLGSAGIEEALARVADSVEKVLADETGRWLLSPEREQAVSEFPVSCLLPDGRLAEYVIDRSFVFEESRWLVDYKNSLPDSRQSMKDFLSAEEARYRSQLENYAQLLSAMHGQRVRSALYFTALPYWHELT